MKSCYFCGSKRVKSSLLQRRIRFDTQNFTFHLCRQCYGFSLYPKLSELQIQKLYSLEYVSNLNTTEVDSQFECDNSSNRFRQGYCHVQSLVRQANMVVVPDFINWNLAIALSTFRGQIKGVATIVKKF